MKKIVIIIFLIFMLLTIVIFSYTFENQYTTDIITEQDNIIKLPRLSLSYYFIISIFSSFLFGIISVIAKKYVKLSWVCQNIFFLFISYIVAQLIIKKGFNFITYNLERDLIFILLSTICIYGIIFISYSIKKSQRI